MWLGDEFEAADLEVAAEGWRSPGAASSTSAGSAPTLELSDAELTQLAEDEGWDVDEVEAIRRLLGRQSDAAPEPAGAPEVASAPDDVITRRPSVPEPWSPDPSKAEHDEELSEEGPSGAAAEAYRRLRKLFPG